MIADNSFINQIDFTKSNHYTLSIRLDTDGFSFCIYNPVAEDALSYFKHEIDPALPLVVNLKNMLDNNEIFHYPYKEINILQISDRFTFVPFDLFEEEQLEPLFYYNFSQKENELIHHNLLRKTNIVFVFGTDKLVYEELNSYFGKFNFYSQGSILIDHFANKSRFGNSKKMYLYFRGNKLDIWCYEKGKLILGNTFICKHTEDILYYSLYIWKQLHFDQEKDEIHLVNLSDKKGELLQTFKEYIKKVFIINPKAEIYNSSQKEVENIPYDIQILSLKEI